MDEWRDRSDARLASLTASETIQNDRLDEHDEEFVEVHHIIDGDPRIKDDSGIRGAIKELNENLIPLMRVMLPDSLGNGGIINRIRALEKDDERKAKNIEYRWKYWTAVTVAVVTLMGFLLKDWPEIRNAFYGPREDVVGKQIDQAKHPKIRRRRVVVHVAAPEEESNGELHDSPFESEK